MPIIWNTEHNIVQCSVDIVVLDFVGCSIDADGDECAIKSCVRLCEAANTICHNESFEPACPRHNQGE